MDNLLIWWIWIRDFWFWIRNLAFLEKNWFTMKIIFFVQWIAFGQFWSRKLLLHAKQTKELGRGDAELSNGTSPSSKLLQTVENGWFENTPFCKHIVQSERTAYSATNQHELLLYVWIARTYKCDHSFQTNRSPLSEGVWSWDWYRCKALRLLFSAT